jgi:hypothetical protein
MARRAIVAAWVSGYRTNAYEASPIRTERRRSDPRAATHTYTHTHTGALSAHRQASGTRDYPRTGKWLSPHIGANRHCPRISQSTYIQSYNEPHPSFLGPAVPTTCISHAALKRTVGAACVGPLNVNVLDGPKRRKRARQLVPQHARLFTQSERETEYVCERERERESAHGRAYGRGCWG